MQQNEIMLKKIEKNVGYFENIYDNRDQYKVEWAFDDAQSKLDGFVEQFKTSCCCSKDLKKRLSKKAKRHHVLRSIFSKVRWGVTITETVISALFVLLISEVSHSVELMIESHMLSLYFLAAFALIKVLFENNIIRPFFERLSWSLYRYSFRMLHSMMEEGAESYQPIEDVTPIEERELALAVE